jgi:hypothetical protein
LESHAVSGGDAHVGVVKEPVHGRSGEGCRHQLVKTGGVQVGGDGDAAFLVGGVDEAKEALGGVGVDR